MEFDLSIHVESNWRPGN